MGSPDTICLKSLTVASSYPALKPEYKFEDQEMKIVFDIPTAYVEAEVLSGTQWA